MLSKPENVLWGKISAEIAKALQNQLKASEISWHEGSITFKAVGAKFTIKIEKDER